MNRTDIDHGLTQEIVDQVRQAEELLTRDEYGNLRRDHRPKKSEVTLREEGAWLGVLVVIVLILSSLVVLAAIN